MIRQHLQSLRSAFQARLKTAKTAVDGLAADKLDSEIVMLLNEITDKIQIVELDDKEQKTLADNYSNDTETFQQAVFDVQNSVRLRFYEETLKPVMARLHRLRLFALFLNRSDYNNYIMKIASMFEAFSQLNAELSLALIRTEIKFIQESKAKAEEAAKEYKAFGSVIEE